MHAAANWLQPRLIWWLATASASHGTFWTEKSQQRAGLESLPFLGAFPEFDVKIPRDTCDISFGDGFEWSVTRPVRMFKTCEVRACSGQGWIGSFSSEDCRWVALIDIKYSTYFMNFHDTSACCCHLTWPQPILGRACSELQASKLTLSLISYDPADTLRILTTW